MNRARQAVRQTWPKHCQPWSVLLVVKKATSDWWLDRRLDGKHLILVQMTWTLEFSQTGHILVALWCGM
jgi:hypothetical protein